MWFSLSLITSQSKLSLNFEANAADQWKDPFLLLLLSDGEVFRIRFLRGRLSLKGMLLAARGIFWTERLYGIPTPTVFKLRQEKSSEVRMSNGVRDPLSKRITSVKSRSFLCQMAVGRDGQDIHERIQYEWELKRHAISPEKWGLELLGWV